MGPISESRFNKNPEFVNPEMKKTGFFFGLKPVHTESVARATQSMKLTCLLQVCLK